MNSSFLYPTNVVPMLNKNKFIALQYKSKLAIGIATHGIGASRAFSIILGREFMQGYRWRH
jgi:hypothetical protein